jgi:hypothetical protein
MWRAFFLAIGVACCLLGAQALAVERAVLHAREPAATSGLPFMGRAPGANREITPPDWAPWTMISTGAVVILYSFTVPARTKKD